MTRYRIIEDPLPPITYRVERKTLFGWRRISGYSISIEGARNIAKKHAKSWVVAEFVLNGTRGDK